MRQQDRLCDCLHDTSASVLLVNALLKCSRATLARVAKPWAVVIQNTNRLCCLCTSVASNGVFSDICMYVCTYVRRCKHVS